MMKKNSNNQMNKIIASSFAIFLIFLTGCATRYQPNSLFSFGGYSEIDVGEDSFIVSFHGNGFTSSERALRLALLRAAELSLKKGYPYFSINFEKDDSSSLTYADTNSSLGYTIFNTVKSPGIRLGVRCYKEKSEDLDVIDAAYYLEKNRTTP